MWMDEEEINNRIDEIVNIEIERLSEYEKKQLLEDDDYTHYHHAYGMFLRNNYIYNGFLKDCMLYLPDDLSEMIFDRIVDRIKKDDNV